MVDVTLELENDPHGARIALLKLREATWEIHVRAAPNELRMLRDIEAAGREPKRSMQLGTCAAVPVFWSANTEGVTVSVGDNEEDWDVSVALTHEVIARITAQVADL